MKVVFIISSVLHSRENVCLPITNETVCCTTLIFRTSEVARFDLVRASDVEPSKSQAVVV